MLFTRLAALIVAASVLWGAAANAGGPLRPFRYGFWSGGAYTEERTGAFTHCSAGVAYDSGVNLFVLVTAQYRWWLGFIDPKWSFTPNAKALIKLSLDGGAPIDRFATVPNGQLLLIPLPDNSPLIDGFRHAAELTVDAEGQALFFKLNETPGMMDRLTGCVRTSLALEDKQRLGASQSANASSSPAAPTEAAAAVSSNTPQKSPERGDTNTTAATPSVAAHKPADGPAAPAETAAAPPPSTAGQQGAAVKSVGPLSTSIASAGAGPPVAKDVAAANLTAASDKPLIAAVANAPPPRMAPTPSSELAGSSAPQADGGAQSEDGRVRASLAALPAASATAGKPEAAPQPPRLAAGPPPLAFTAVNPTTSAPAPARSSFAPQPGAASALEEVRLATEFLGDAQLPDAHLVDADKPPALADFAAVWRSADAAGAVKIIPPGPDVSALAIASNLIAVDPQLCKGDFSTARFHTDIGNRTVFSAVLSCSEANEDRVTEYLIAPRQQGGFVVFAVIRSKDGGQALDLDRQNLEGLSRAAIHAIGGQG